MQVDVTPSMVANIAAKLLLKSGDFWDRVVKDVARDLKEIAQAEMRHAQLAALDDLKAKLGAYVEERTSSAKRGMDEASGKAEASYTAKYAEVIHQSVAALDEKLGPGGMHRALVEAIRKQHGVEIATLARKSIRQVEEGLRDEL